MIWINNDEVAGGMGETVIIDGNMYLSQLSVTVLLFYLILMGLASYSRRDKSLTDLLHSRLVFAKHFKTKTRVLYAKCSGILSL